MSMLTEKIYADNIKHMRPILGAFVIILMCSSASVADIFKSVDENGVVCYTDTPVNRGSERVMRGQEAEPVQRRTVSAEPARKELQNIVHDKAAKYEMDPSLIHAVIKAESNGNPFAVSRKGAKGLMQLMPTTASDLQVRDPFDPEENIDGGTRYLKYLIEKFNGDLTLALAAYNAGPKTVEKSGAVPRISETQEYVRRVLSLYNGKLFYPGSSSSSSKERPEQIYKVITEDGVILFTNSPLSKRSPRL